MNLLTIIVLAVFVLSIFNGYQKGFLKTAFSLVSWILVLVLCEYTTPMVTTALIEKTDVEVVIQATVDAKINEVIAESLETSGATELEAMLPAELKTMLLGEGVSLQDAVANGIPLDTTLLVNEIVGILGFVLTVILLRIAAKLVELVLGIVGKLPLIGPMDKMLGLACGAGSGLIWAWVILAIVSMLALTGTNTEFAAQIAQSEILVWLQDNNLILNAIVGLQ